ncbi:PH domain-containing protein [Lentzea aerocolonigenes]|uniref:PH domain-containing protein n=1 Tax=Lentzea aerocolonigenes TaxID=68170 RepID=UPI00068A339C|nr:PH domain-containing protein [Lentzea aerocolonigenes]MCP2246443.1 putative membrane protein [Lentzea aerocolonigenes]
MSTPAELPAGLPAAPEFTEPLAEWHRLHVRMLVVRPLNEGIAMLVPILVLLFTGNGEKWRLIASGVTVAAILAFSYFIWRTTKYRITDDQVELHTGLLTRKQLAVPRDRIRTVDLTSKPGHRVFGLSAVRIGTGQQDTPGTDGLTLDAVTQEEAERLRVLLLQKAVVPRGEAHAVPVLPESAVISQLDLKWLKFAPLSLSGLVAIGALFGVLSNYADDLGLHPVQDLWEWLFEHPSLTLFGAFAVALVVAGLVLSVPLYVLQFWNYRLTREPDGTLRVQRGLLTTRSVSVEEQRLRGVDIQEPLLVRAGRGAKLAAVTTGLGSKGESNLLLPPAPLSVAHQVSQDVLKVADDPTLRKLRKHPFAALRRSVVRHVVPWVVIAAGLAAWAPSWAWPIPVAIIPFAALIGWDNYRSLGNALDERYLVTRNNSLVRSTVALQRTGIIGWRIRRSFFQRRSGLMTIGATTAAGAGVYHVTDVGESDGLALADAAVPDLLRPFLVEVSPEQSTVEGQAERNV